MLQDLRYAVRTLAKRPALATAIVLTIGLGLGAAAAIFTASDAALVEPLPYAEPERLVHLWEVRAGTDERSPTSYPTLLDWRARAHSFTGLEGYDPSNFIVGVGDGARMLRGAQVTAGFFRLLGVPISAGRDFLRNEDATTGAAVVIVTERLARSGAGGSALDQALVANGTAPPIPGAPPPAFPFALLGDADVSVPLVADEQRGADRFDRSIHVVGRLRDHVPLTSARAELSAVTAALAREHPNALAGRTVAALPLRDALLGNMKPILASLLAAVALLLVIMGANLALLMLTRYVARAPELAMRSALGATRRRVLRQLLVESLVPSVVGAALATVVGQVATRSLLRAIPEGVRIDMPYLTNVGLDARVIGVMMGLATLLAVGFRVGAAPPITKMPERAGGTRTTPALGRRRLRRTLAAAQVALTVVLLVAAGLLALSFRNLVRRDVGFRDPAGLVAARAPLTGPRYQSPVAQRQFYGALVSRSAALPGVRHAGLINEVPAGGSAITTFEPVDHPIPRSVQPRAALPIVGGEYFPTMGIPVVAGRTFDARDRSDAPPGAGVSLSFAKLLARDGATVGRRVRLATTGPTEWQGVGGGGDVHGASLDAGSPPVVYLSHLQIPENRMTLVLRTQMGVASAASQVRAIVKSLDAGVPVYAVTTLDQQLSESKAVFSRRFPMILCGVFAMAALALTLVALYAICMHEVLTRRREFGIRLALGGSPGSIRRLILGDAMRLGAAAIGTGGIVATLVSRAIRAVLFGVTTTDWRVYAVVAAGVLASAFLAILGPALRAGAVTPNAVMRGE